MKCPKCDKEMWHDEIEKAYYCKDCNYGTYE